MKGESADTDGVGTEKAVSMIQQAFQANQINKAFFKEASQQSRWKSGNDKA